MRNVVKLIVIAIVVVIGSIISIKNLKDINEGYIVSDIENKNEVYEESKTIDINNNTKNIMQISKVETSLNDKVTIYISGEVKNPGVVELKYDDRLGDGVDLCGGLTKDANLNGINLAMKIKDEGHYIIPKVGEETADTVTNDNKLKIGDSFYLPFSFQNTCISEYTTEAACYTDEQAHEKAMKRLNVYLDDLRKKGVEILENNVTIEVSNGTCTAEGYIVTKEPIGVPAELIIMEQGEEP